VPKKKDELFNEENSAPTEARTTSQTETYTPQLDIPKDKLEEISNWIIDEIQRAQNERTDMEANIVEWERLYEARPAVAKKDFPWEGASNLVIPTIATAVDAVLARIMNATFGSRDVWAAVSRSSKWMKLAKPIEKWLNWVANNVMNLKKACRSWFLSCIKIGTGVAKLTWERRVRNVMYKGLNGGLVNETVVVHEGPKVINIPLVDFYTSNDAIHTQDLQNCEWVAERGLYTYKQLKELESSGIFVDVDRIKASPRTGSTNLEKEIEQNTGISIQQYKDLEIYEFWASYDVNDDGVLEEIVGDIHLETRSMLRCVYNPYRHQERPHHLIRYMPRDNSIFGIGMGQMLQHIQEEITTIHNQRIDNGTLANTTAFKARRGATSAPSSIYPGAKILVDEMDDFSELQMGRSQQSQLQEELHTGAIGEKRTGVSDYTVGRESAAIGSNATATSVTALIAEGNKRFKMTITDIRESLTDMAHQVIMLYQQFVGDGTLMYEIFDDEEKTIVQEYFQLPPEYSKSNILLDTPAISEAYNKDIEKQTFMTLAQIMQMLYKNLMEAFATALNPQAPQPMKDLAIQGADSAAKIFERILESFDVANSKAYVPDVKAMLGVPKEGDPNAGQTGNPISPPAGGLEPPMVPGPTGTPAPGAVPPEPNGGSGIPGNMAGLQGQGPVI
jgi:hypothetical protein